MSKRSESDWRILFSAHAASGLSAAAFCRERGLCPKYFSLRKRQLDQEEKVLPAFKTISLNASGMTIELVMGPMMLRIPSSVSAQWLASLIERLR